MAILSKERQLHKELTLFDVYTIATGATLSSGFFLLPGLAAAEAGPAVVLSYFLAVLPMLPGILSKIELATAMPRAGGEYFFIDRSLGPLFGTVTGMGTWCGLVLKTSFALIGIAVYVELFFPHVPFKPIVVAIAIVFGWLNLYGARKSRVLQLLLVLGLLVLLVWFTAVGMPQVDRRHFDQFTARGWDHIFAAAGLVCVSFMGLTKVASVAEEVKNPERNLTLGIMLALVTAVAVYGFGTFVIVGVLEPEKLNGTLTPVADAAEVMVGPTGAVVMTVAAILAFLSVGNAGILSASRYPLAMSRDHLLPRWFRHLNTHRTPRNAILVTVAMILLFVTVFDPAKIAKLASAFLLMLFAFNCLAVIVMRESRIDSYDPGFRSPWYPWLQIAGIIGPLAFIVVMGWLPIAFTVGLATLATTWYFYYGKRRVSRGGAIYHLFARLGQRRFEGLDRELRSILKEKGLRAHDPYDEVVVAASVIDETGDVTFEGLVRRASDHLSVRLPLSAELLANTFMEGTRVGATPVSHGAALPHQRLPNLDAPLMVIARAAQGMRIDVSVDFIDHMYEDPIYAVIFLVSPEEDASQHLRILAQIAQRIDDDHFIDDWQAAAGDQALKQILLRDERFLSLDLEDGSPAAELVGKPMQDLALPEGSLVAMIHRGGTMIVPRGSTILRSGDSLTLVGEPAAIAQLKAQYAAV